MVAVSIQRWENNMPKTYRKKYGKKRKYIMTDNVDKLLMHIASLALILELCLVLFL